MLFYAFSNLFMFYTYMVNTHAQSIILRKNTRTKETPSLTFFLRYIFFTSVYERVSKPGPGPNVKFLPEVESLKSAVQELKKQNINKIIAVGHSGIDMDKKIAKEVDGVDIVVGGHTNTFLYTGNSRIRTKHLKI